MATLLSYLLLLLFIGAVSALSIWTVIRSEARAVQMLDNWLRENNYQLLQKSTPWVKDNPFWMSSNRSQKVFKVTIRAPDGTTCAAWLRCGNALWGTAIDQIEVKWDETAQTN